MEAPLDSRRDRRRAWLALALLVPAPTLGTAMALHVDPGGVGQAAFLLAKIWVVALPAVWYLLVERQRVRVTWPTAAGLPAAIGTGIVIFLGIAGAYWLAPAQWFDAQAIRDVAFKAGLNTPVRYLAGAVYWCTINSIAEEYIWRWFVFRKAETALGAGSQGATADRRVTGRQVAAVLLSGALFTVHHVVALTAYFGWQVTTLASLGVLIGGVTWSALYLRYRSILPGYISHVFADIIIFYIGWKLIFELPA